MRPIPDTLGPPINTSLTDNNVRDLGWLASNGRVLEIGTAYGFSTVVMANVARGVVTIDPHITHASLPIVQFNLDVYGVKDRVDIKVGTSQEWCPQLELESFDLAFIDGDHTGPGVWHDVKWAQRLVKTGGYIACHDYGEDTCPEIQPTLDTLYPKGPDRLVDTLFVVQQ